MPYSHLNDYPADVRERASRIGSRKTDLFGVVVILPAKIGPFPEVVGADDFDPMMADFYILWQIYHFHPFLNRSISRSSRRLSAINSSRSNS